MRLCPACFCPDGTAQPLDDQASTRDAVAVHDMAENPRSQQVYHFYNLKWRCTCTRKGEESIYGK
jgi:hypothetical protein